MCVCVFLNCLYLIFSPLSSNMNAANSFKFNVLSLNVRGIGDQIKRRCIFSYLKGYNTCKLFPPIGLNGRRETDFSLRHLWLKLNLAEKQRSFCL